MTTDIDRFWPKHDMDAAPDGSFIRYSDYVTLAKRLERAETEIANMISEWEALPGGRNYSPREVEHWVMAHMQPAINRLRRWVDGK